MRGERQIQAAMREAREAVRARAIGDVVAERDRQTELWGNQWEPGVEQPGVKLAILTEEVGEVAKELLEGGGGRATASLRTELIQVAAVAVAWVESLEGAPNYHLGDE